MKTIIGVILALTLVSCSLDNPPQACHWGTVISVETVVIYPTPTHPAPPPPAPDTLRGGTYKVKSDCQGVIQTYTWVEPEIPPVVGSRFYQ